MKLKRAKAIVRNREKIAGKIAVVENDLVQLAGEINSLDELRRAASSEILSARERIVELEAELASERQKESSSRVAVRQHSESLVAAEARRSKARKVVDDLNRSLPLPGELAEAQTRIENPIRPPPASVPTGVVNVSPIKIGVKLKTEGRPSIGRLLASSSSANRRRILHRGG